MAFEVVEVQSDSDFLELLDVEFAAFETPFNPLRPLFFPIFGEGHEARQDAIEKAAQRTAQRHRETPGSRWIKVVESATGKIVGGAVWHFYDRDVYTGQQPTDCSWWPEGDSRRFARAWARGVWIPRSRMMRRPHACECPYTQPCVDNKLSEG